MSLRQTHSGSEYRLSKLDVTFPLIDVVSFVLGNKARLILLICRLI
jgi:hypothetical protein